MSKFLTKKSLFLASLITGFLVILSLIFSLAIGVNHAVNTDDHQTVTVKVNDYHFNTDLDDVESVCEDVFKANGLKYVYVYHGAMSTDGELTYVFKNSADLSNVKAALESAFEVATADQGVVDGAEVFVEVASEQMLLNVVGAYAWRTVLAIAVFAVLTFVYVTIRYRWNMGIVAAFSTILGAAFATAVILLVRVPVTSTVLSVVVISAMVSTVMTLFVLNKLRSNLNTEAFEEQSAEEIVANSYACKEILALVSILGAAIILVGAIARLNVFFFGLTALIGLICATVVGAWIAPGVCVLMVERMQKVAAETNKSGYVGAKKSEDEE